MAHAENTASGDLFVVSAPSGAGKTSLLAALLGAERGLHLSISHTTRSPRSTERDALNYHFVSDETFTAMVDADAFLEHARVFDHRYGTARESVEKHLAAGEDVILEIDWQGARQIRQRLPGCVGIFILPPSRESLAERLAGRAEDSPEVIARRLRDAVTEMSHYREFDYVVVNDHFDRALSDLRAIVRARRLRRERQTSRHRELIASLLA
jgi:guanylate kinase